MYRKYGWKLHGAVMEERQWHFGIKLEANGEEIGEWEAWITLSIGKFLVTFGKYHYIVKVQEEVE